MDSGRGLGEGNPSAGTSAREATPHRACHRQSQTAKIVLRSTSEGDHRRLRWKTTLNILLDTCTFLWITEDARELSPVARELFSDRDNTVYLSVVSSWEIAMKFALGRLSLPAAPDRFVPDQRRRRAIESLALEEESVLHLQRLPRLHNDPFDRMLVCQALAHGLVILTPDGLLAQYPARTLW